MDIPDHELAQRFRSGNSSAFEELVRRWDHRVLNLAYRLTGDPEMADDIRQLAFLKIYRGLAAFEASARFSTWLHAVVINVARDHLRSKQARTRLLERSSARKDPRASAPPAHAPLERHEESARVASAIGTLSPHAREVVILRHYHELPFSEIAKILDIPASTAKSRMAKALEVLRDRLKPIEI